MEAHSNVVVFISFILFYYARSQMVYRCVVGRMIGRCGPGLFTAGLFTAGLFVTAGLLVGGLRVGNLGRNMIVLYENKINS